MNVWYAAAGRAALAVMVIAWAAGRLEAGGVRLDGVSLELPEGWRALEPPDETVAAWARSSGSGTGASLVVEVHARPTAVRRGLLPAEKQAMERALGAAPGLSGFRLIDHGVVEVDGVPARRIRGQVEIEGRTVEQLQLVISGPRTVLLTFSWEGVQIAEDDFDAIARSARVDRRAGFLAEGGAGGLAGVLGLLAGMALASRRIRRMVRG